MPGALDGLKVVDLSSHLSGPYCAMLLGDHGADVIKVERPGKGDDARGMPPYVGGEGAPFMLWNRNKRSVALDLKQTEDREKLLKLIDEADILIENFRPGAMARLGMSYEELKKRNPRLIYGAISGFGQTGPYANRGGFDLVTQGMSGLMAMCGPKDGPPHRLPIAISDVAAGMHLCVGILAALEARNRTGEGQFVETSLLESAVAMEVYEAANVFATDKEPERLGQAHRGSSPYQIIEVQDGWIILGAAQQSFWEKVCDIIGAPELKEDPRFVTNANRVANNDLLVEILTGYFKQKPSAHWLAILESEGIPSGPVMGVKEILTDSHMIEREMIVETEHPTAGRMRTLGVVAKLSATPGSIRRPAPRLNEHHEEVF